MGLLPTGTGDWLAFESRGLVSLPLSAVALSELTRFVSRPQRYHCFENVRDNILLLSCSMIDAVILSSHWRSVHCPVLDERKVKTII